MSLSSKRVLIVGAGLAGLACANALNAAGLQPLLLEKSETVGGRVRTDVLDGFLLDRGFQVFLSAYPEAGALLDKNRLQLHPFKPGALVFSNGRLHRVMDVFRQPQHLLSSALAPIGSLTDKMRVALLKFWLHHTPLDRIPHHPDLTTEDFLLQVGFSNEMIDVFFRSFYGGIFLERSLHTSSRMFEFTFKMFSEGHATLPAEGMAAIPRQLAARLPPNSIRLNQPVSHVQPNAVTLDSGETLSADAVVVATDVSHARQFLPNLPGPKPAWRAVTCLYFAAPQSPLREPIIVLNGTGTGLVNNLCVPSDVSPSYAPKGQALISATLLGHPEGEALETRVRHELESWFGPQVQTWRHLKTDRVDRALPEQPPGKGMQAPGYLFHDGVFLCGDHLWSASIEGAIISGKNAAAAVLQRLQTPS